MAIKFMKNNAKELKPNIFMQQTEPETKEGIWIQGNKTISNVEVVEHLDAELIINENKYASMPTTMGTVGPSRPRAFGVGDNVFVIGYSYKFCKLIVSENKWEMLTSPVTGQSTPIGYKNGYLYMLETWNYSNKAYKYSITDNTWEEISVEGSLPSENYLSISTQLGDDIYMMEYNAKSPNLYKYNITTSTITALSAPPKKVIRTGDDYNALCSDNKRKLYFITQDKELYEYDTVNDSYTKLLTLTDLTEHTSTSCNLCYCKGSVYIFYTYTTLHALKYDTETKDAFVDYINVDGTYGHMGVTYLENIDEIIYVCVPKSYSFKVPSQVLKDKSVVIEQGNSSLKTQLYENKNIQGRLLYGFENVVYNTTESGLDDTLPTYYGTGTEWVKFKN